MLLRCYVRESDVEPIHQWLKELYPAAIINVGLTLYHDKIWETEVFITGVDDTFSMMFTLRWG